MSDILSFVGQSTQNYELFLNFRNLQKLIFFIFYYELIILSL